MFWQLAWRLAGDVVFFGPGHVSEESWEAGVKKFISSNGPFDVIVSAELLISSLNTEISHTLEKAVAETYDFNFDVKKALAACQKNYEEFVDAKSIKVVSMLEFDSYNMHHSHKARLDETDIFVVGWGEEFIKPRAEIEDLNEEVFGPSVNDRWYDFVNDNRARIISSPAMVSETEFYWDRIEKRSSAWMVQGARYYKRVLLRENLKKHGIPCKGEALANWISFLNRVDPKLLTKPLVRNLFNFFWQERFRRSKFAYTCGSSLGFPIRKYFEIPASGALLLADKCNGFSALGFRDKENSLIIDVTYISEVGEWLQNNTELIQKIAKSGQELVWNKHTISARAKQYKKAINAIYSKQFFGSKWVNGNFQLNKKDVGKFY